MLLLIPWVRNGAFPPALAGVGVAVLLVDLLATGGIGIPAVAQSLWLLLALGLDRAWPRDVPRAVVLVLLAMGLGLSVACHQTAYARVLPCQSLQRLARREYFDGHRQSARELLQRAVAADPRSSDARAFLAEIYLDSWLASLAAADYEGFETHDALARRMAPEAAPIWRAAANRYQRAFARTDASGRRLQPRAIGQAIEIAQRAVELYPGSAIDHAALAINYQLRGDKTAYRREAQTALELDDRMMHIDKKLPETLRRRLEAAVDGARVNSP
jgi:tetratricopeptide (TPR) repeat protein